MALLMIPAFPANASKWYPNDGSVPSLLSELFDILRVDKTLLRRFMIGGRTSSDILKVPGLMIVDTRLGGFGGASIGGGGNEDENGWLK